MKKNKSRSGYLLKRVIAFGFDWYFSSVLLNIGLALSQNFIGKELKIITNFNEFSIIQIIISILIILLISLFYYVYIPVKVWPGQTLMMRFLQLKIVDEETNEVTGYKTMVKRFLIGCLLLEGSFYGTSTIIVNLIIDKLNLLYKGFDFNIVIGGIMIILSISSVIYALKDKNKTQLFHDKISQTCVIDLYNGGNKTL